MLGKSCFNEYDTIKGPAVAGLPCNGQDFSQLFVGSGPSTPRALPASLRMTKLLTKLRPLGSSIWAKPCPLRWAWLGLLFLWLLLLLLLH
jgi:hypothetical protein